MKPKSARSAFSLAEMMIALALLAMGLLVIGAALPIGVRYTQQSANLANGKAAATYALDLIEQNVCIAHQVYNTDANNYNDRIAEPMVFVPRARDHEDTDGYQLHRRGQFMTNDDDDYEPVIKVRPLFVQNLNAWPGTPNTKLVIDDNYTGMQIRNWVGADDTRECDYSYSSDDGNYLRPALSCLATLYPPIPGDGLSRTPDYYMQAGHLYDETDPLDYPGMLRKALGQRVGWTAFYRRVSYAEGSDPTLYEFIVVVTQRPSPNHRFAMQGVTISMIHGLLSQNEHSSGTTVTFNSNRGNKENKLNINYLPKYDCAAPVPWLVTFAGLPAPDYGFNEYGNPLPLGYKPATLSFWLRDTDNNGIGDYDGLFPIGSIFLPARNGLEPSNPDLHQLPIGFGPPAPSTLPIYEVVDRPSGIEVVVKFNGYYPRQGALSTHGTPDSEDWPVWVIPPSFKELNGSGDPVFDDESPILAVSRRYIRLRELP